MKRTMRMLFVVVMCFMLAGGVGVPNTDYGNTSTTLTVATVQAKAKVSKKFKKAMDKYLKFYKKYCKFMKKYKKGANSVELLSDYNDLLEQQAEFDRAFKKWKKKKMNSSELAYYSKINIKVLKMLEKV